MKLIAAGHQQNQTFLSFQLFLMSWKRKVGLLRPLRPRSEMEFVFSFFDERWVMGRHSGHTLREEKKTKEKTNGMEPGACGLLSFLHFIHFIFDELMKLREKKRRLSCWMALSPLLDSLVGYGLAGQPRAPPKEANAKREREDKQKEWNEIQWNESNERKEN